MCSSSNICRSFDFEKLVKSPYHWQKCSAPQLHIACPPWCHAHRAPTSACVRGVSTPSCFTLTGEAGDYSWDIQGVVL